MWQDECVPLLRGVFGDLGDTYEYVDNRLEEILVYAAHYVASEFNFANDYTVTIATSTITPDPTTSADKDFINLVVLRAAMMLTNYEYKTASTKAYVIKDGPSSIDGKAVAEHKKQLAATAKRVYDNAVLLYRAGKAVSIAAVMSTANIDYYGTTYSNSRYSPNRPFH